VQHLSVARHFQDATIAKQKEQAMYAAIKAVHENGQVILQKPPPTAEKTNVIVMFIKDAAVNIPSPAKGVKIGSLAGKGYKIPDDFNQPLADLREYM
jgi:hypothetical protein